MAFDRQEEVTPRSGSVLAAGISLILLLSLNVNAQDTVPGLKLRLPTENDALYRGEGAEFYQYIQRDFQGVLSTPWEGGQYGFVRNPVATANGLVYTRFHEGIDIRPLHRDARGEPLDEVHAIAEGLVVYTNAAPGASNYGRYVVVEHIWDGCPYYSLYAHLSVIAATIGQKVKLGDKLAVMGHTGEGLDQARAHLHLELNLMLNQQFDAWHQTYFVGEVNRHGLYNGINLTGLDIARFFLALRRNPSLTIPDFLRHEETFYKVIIANSPHFELARRYPWMAPPVAPGKIASWEVSFTRSGVPLKLEENDRIVTGPELSYVKPSAINYSYQTRNVIGGTGKDPHLTETGVRLMKLLNFPD